MTVFKGELQQQFSSSLFNSIYSFIPVQPNWSCDLRIQGKCSFSIWKYILRNPTLKIYRFRLNIGPRSLETELSLSPPSSSFSSSLVICWRSARPAMPPRLALPLPGRPPRLALASRKLLGRCFTSVGMQKTPEGCHEDERAEKSAVINLSCLGQPPSY